MPGVIKVEVVELLLELLKFPLLRLSPWLGGVKVVVVLLLLLLFTLLLVVLIVTWTRMSIMLFPLPIMLSLVLLPFTATPFPPLSKLGKIRQKHKIKQKITSMSTQCCNPYCTYIRRCITNKQTITTSSTIRLNTIEYHIQQ